ncbi:MAG: S-layer homology domain-containing protein [Acutalibacter sp.]
MKKLMSVLLALVLVLAMVPVAASAESTELPTPVDGVITLTENVELSSSYEVTGSLTLDLNGFTISNSGELVSNAGALAYLFRIDEGASLTLRDSSSGGVGSLSVDNARGILNNGTFIMESGKIEATSTQAVDGETTDNSKWGYCVVNAVTEESFANNQKVVCEIRGGTLESDAYGMYIQGAGVPGTGLNTEGTETRNDLMLVTISGDAEITASMAIGTNASSGQFAGFTLNIEGGTIRGKNSLETDIDDGCALYLPAVGITNISDGTISGGQAIRICAGELNITGGQIIGTTVGDNSDLIAGGSGGTQGAIVVGKAGGGYVGNIDINISDGAVVTNTATAEGEQTKPAIVVSDKNMGNETMEYNDLAITVTVDGAAINGDVVKVSNLTTGANTQDGGNTSLTISNTTVDGNVTNQSKTGLTIRDTNITGNVSNTSEGSTAILGDSTVSGKIDDSSDAGATGTIFNEKDQNDESEIVAINETTAVTYTDLATAISEAKEGETVTLTKDVAVEDTITIGEGVTLDGNGKTITYAGAQKTENPSVLILANSGADNVTVKNVTLDTKSNLKHGVEFFAADNGKLSGVTVNGGSGTSVQVNGSTGFKIENCALNPGDGAYANIEYCLSESAQNAGGTTPSMTIENVTFDSTATYEVWADKDTVANIKEELEKAGVEKPTDADVKNAISGNVTTENSDSVTITVGLEGNTTDTITKPSTKPSTPGGTPTEPEEPTWPFEDVTEGEDWFYDAVAYVYENGIMAGTGETIFDPYMELDRAMAAQLFYNLEGKPAVTGDSTFTDVTSGHWAVDAITWAAQNDIVAGIGGGLYDPDSNVTREQFAQMLYNYAKYKGYDLTATGDLTQFPDADAISDWAETALSWANGKGLINGHENGTIDPKGSTIRAQAASIMANFDQNVAK